MGADTQVFTIGFTATSAESFFGRLQQARVARVIDVRLNNVSQLAGFAKRKDLPYFLHALCGAEYIHLPELAPTAPMLMAYRAGDLGWDEYAKRFLQLMADRRIETRYDRALLSGACLLCSENQPHQCHRRLVAEYLSANWGQVAVTHL